MARPASSLYELLAIAAANEIGDGVRTDSTRAVETVDDDRLATLAVLSGEFPE